MENPIYIYGGIGWDFDAQYMRLILEDATGDLEIRINSGGGDVFEGQAIYSLLDEYRRKTGSTITVHVDALAASIASVIAMVGDSIIMANNALMMVHNPWTPETGGDASTLRETADVLDKVAETIVSVYETRTGLDRETISALMDDETWMSASEAVNLGFATQIASPSEAVAASIKMFNYSNAPQWLKEHKPKVENQVANNQEKTTRLNVVKARLAVSRCCNK